MVRDRWEVGSAYEAYVGRWSRVVAWEFVRWVDVPLARRRLRNRGADRGRRRRGGAGPGGRRGSVARAGVPTTAGGSIALTARAWAVRGVHPPA
jgi:hypothetical protein